MGQTKIVFNCILLTRLNLKYENQHRFHSQKNCFSLFIIHSISSMFYVKGNMETIVFYSFFWTRPSQAY